MRILVTGGAGYIGSHMCRMLATKGHTVVVVDTLEHGHAEALPTGSLFVQGDVGNPIVLESVFSQAPIDAVIHFAGYISVEESVRDPERYFTNNLVRPIVLLDVMGRHRVDKMIFSSTAAVYGDPEVIPIPESHPKNPASPYGLSKYFFEKTLAYYEQKAQIRSVSLRYFNAAGASLDGIFGEAHSPETHIIPLAISTALGQRSDFTLYGTDYPTKDGTCERDYIHVEDLCAAHICALDALASGHGSGTYNVGTGIGITNRQVIAAVERASGKTISIRESPRRPGDSHSLVADSTKLRTDLGWVPQHSDLETIVASAWKWHSTHPQGYQKV